MPGLLLIAWEDGRPVKTYGVNRAESCNMKFTFICITAAVFCSVCASDDLGIYPGLKHNFNREDIKPSLENYEIPDLDLVYKHLMQDIPISYRKEDYQDEDISDIMRGIQELQDFRSRHTNHQPYYQVPRHHYDLEKIHKYFSDSDKSNLESFHNRFAQILDDSRIYQQADDINFKAEEEDEQEGIPKLYGQPSLEEQERMLSLEKIGFADDVDRPDEVHHEHREIKVTDEEDFPSGQYQYAKVADDPSEFAYRPSDPRFYGKHHSTTFLGTDSGEDRANRLTDSNTSEDPFKVKLRSDQNSGEGDRGRADTISFKNANGEVVPRTGVDVTAVKSEPNSAGVYIIAIIAGISAAATVGLIAVAIGWYNLQKHVKNASDVEYPAYGVTGPNKDISPSGDRRLAQSAQMYHYQHQKQQIIAMERAPPGDRHGSVSDADSDEENEEGDYTVYECPGLAPTGEMEVKNPLFQDDPTPAQTPAIKPNEENK